MAGWKTGTTMAIEISTAKKGDLPRLIEIFHNPDLKTSLEESRWFVNCYFDYHQILLARVDDEIQGACFWRIEGERYSGLGWIENLWVEERLRRSGVGENLLRRAIDEVKDHFLRFGVRARKIVLTTQVERMSARSLYEKVGFKEVASLAELYDRGGHDLVYVLDL